MRLRDTKGTGRQGQSERNGDRDGDRDGGTARDVETGAPFTLALRLVSNWSTFKLVWPNHIVIWCTESSFQSALGTFTQLP